MIELRRHCNSCNAPVLVTAGQHVSGGSVVWSGHYRCLKCGSEAALDGIATDDLERAALLRADGVWGLHVAAETHAIKVTAAMRIREALGLTPKQGAELVAMLPGCAFRGTEAEALRLQEVLGRSGVQSEVGRIE